MTKTVFISGMGGDIAQGVATILRENRPDLRLVGADIHRFHGGGRLVDRLVTLPRADAPEYLSALRQILEEESAGFFLPMTEAELKVLLGKKSELPEMHWMTSGDRVVDAGLDKWKTIQALSGLGLEVPWTTCLPSESQTQFPCILKSRFGSGSRGLAMVRNDAELNFYSGKLADPIVQELLLPDDREVTCAVYRTRDDRVGCLQMLRRLTGGFTGWARIISDIAIEKMCVRIAEGLDLRGSMNVQLRVTPAGPRVFEINPRFSSTVLMRHRVGFTDVLWALAEAEGRTVEFPCIPENLELVRVQDAAIIDRSKI